MGLSALQTRGERLGAAATGDYRGATTAARFGDPAREFEALRSGCGVYDLGFRTKLSLTGGDRVRWLNGMVTNNIRDLATGHGVYAFLLNPQGHILGDLVAYNRGESITIDTDVSQTEKIAATFDHYIIMDDVEVANLGEQLTAVGVAGTKARSVLAAAGVSVPDLRALQIVPVVWREVPCSLIQGEFENEYEMWISPDHVLQLWDALASAGAQPVGFEALELRRIVDGVPQYGVDIRERDLPQETEQARALNFNKGCYIGQEIVERIRSRGAVHRKFTGFMTEEVAQITRGTKIVSGEKEVGEVTSAADVPLAGGTATVALGYIRREAGTPGREVSIGGMKAKVVQLPVTESSLKHDEQSLEHHPA